jgi:hypothetical protein
LFLFTNFHFLLLLPIVRFKADADPRSFYANPMQFKCSTRFLSHSNHKCVLQSNPFQDCSSTYLFITSREIRSLFRFLPLSHSINSILVSNRQPNDCRLSITFPIDRFSNSFFFFCCFRHFNGKFKFRFC